LKSKKVLETADANRVLSAAVRYAVGIHAPVSIAVVDDGGFLLALTRLDGAVLLTPEIATRKAKTAALHRKPSKYFEDMVGGGRIGALCLPQTAQLEGGEPIMLDEVCIGAVGVSGVASALDAEIARAGVAGLSERT
jgi:glc operon protein GlcG